ncbi:hypothetical protein DYU11_30575 [Fibrisoma montanum]|uniref:Uncharacterized protein n=1 Tax=Fibrisoma montanum TaxID=2305895 RepID=A0A418LX43_9BACT|nr:hypothetical protein [Fibrisoma montanum]RIV17823.1 hypothetical protein DYU11_30575 [Fibrisoma montanum]
MKKKEEAVGLLVGNGDAVTKQICQALAKEGITALVRQKDTDGVLPADEQVRQLAGEPGKDLFFNGWKLLF